MSKRLAFQTDHVQGALEYCAKNGRGDGRTATNVKLLELLRIGGNLSSTYLAREAQCGRTHVFDVLAWLRDGTLDRLVAGGRFRKSAILSDERREELFRKLGNEFKCAKDVADWYEQWSHEEVPLATIYGWCRKRKGEASGFSFRAAKGRRRTSTRSKPQHRTELVLTLEAVDELRERQRQERITDRIPEGEFEGRYVPNLVKRIEGVLRCAAKHPISQIATDLRVTRKTVRLWVQRYKHGRLEKLCEVKYGGRPRFKING